MKFTMKKGDKFFTITTVYGAPPDSVIKSSTEGSGKAAYTVVQKRNPEGPVWIRHQKFMFRIDALNRRSPKLITTFWFEFV